MVPVLHQIHVQLICYNYLYRGQVVVVPLLLPLSSDNQPQSKGCGQDDVTGIERLVQVDRVLLNGHAHFETIVSVPLK